jgi:hypothetical protein
MNAATLRTELWALIVKALEANYAQGAVKDDPTMEVLAAEYSTAANDAVEDALDAVFAVDGEALRRERMALCLLGMGGDA